MDLGEAMEGGQLEHRLYLVFEEDGEYDEVARWRSAQAGDDVGIVIGELGQENLLLLQDALTDQPFARNEAVGELLAPLEGIGAEQLEDRCPVLGVQQVEDDVLGRDDGRQV